MNRLRGSLVLTLSLGVGLAAGGGKKSLAEPAPEVRVDRNATVSRVDAVLPGALVSYALPRGADGSRRIVLLVRAAAEAAVDAPTDGKKHDAKDEKQASRELPPCPGPATGRQADASPVLALYELDLAAGRLVPLRDDLPSDATSLDAVAIEPGQGEDLILARPGELLLLARDETTGPEPLFRDADATWKHVAPRAVRYPGLSDRPWAVAASLGRMSLYGPSAEGQASWTELARVELPREADVESAGIRVSSPRPQLVGADSGGTLYFATPPKSFGSSRVQTTLIAFDPSGAATVTDCWARLPAAEEILDSSFLLVDDRPVLLATTKPADKLDLFGEKKLRLYSLERDRSRLGMLPLFAAESRMNLWQDGTAQMFDVDGDGRDDLVVGYWKGILHDRVVLDAYLRKEEGFDPSERTTALDVAKGDREFVEYGADLTGDGIPDLLVRGKPGLLVYPGRVSKNGKRLVKEDPTKIRLADDEQRFEDNVLFRSYSGARPRVIDLDGDGTSEILLVSQGQGDDPGVFSVLRLERRN